MEKPHVDGLRQARIRISWPDEAVGPWTVELTWDIIGGRLEVVGLNVSRHPFAPPAPLHAIDVRRLNLGAVAERCRPQLLDLYDADKHPYGAPLTWRIMAEEELARAADSSSADELEEASAEADLLSRLANLSVRRTEELRAVSPPKARSGRPPQLTPEHFEKVAAIYRAAYARGDYPTRAVERYFHLSRSAAAKRIARCRQLGVLGPTDRRKAGEMSPGNSE